MNSVVFPCWLVLFSKCLWQKQKRFLFLFSLFFICNVVKSLLGFFSLHSQVLAQITELALGIFFLNWDSQNRRTSIAIYSSWFLVKKYLIHISFPVHMTGIFLPYLFNKVCWQQREDWGTTSVTISSKRGRDWPLGGTGGAGDLSNAGQIRGSYRSSAHQVNNCI